MTMLSKTVVILALLFCGLTVPVIAQSIERPKQGEYAYIWRPRNNDVSRDPSDKDRRILHALLALCQVVNHKVQSGENLDFVIRSLFYLSHSNQPNAYALYKARILNLNPALETSFSRTGEMIRVPSGPQYSITTLEPLALPVTLRKKTFERLSRKAYFGPAKQLQAKTSDLQLKIRRSLAQYTALTSSELQTMSTEEVVSKAQSVGMVPVINADDHPEESMSQVQVMTLRVGKSVAERETFNELKTDEDNGSLLPGIFPVADNIVVNCPPCSTPAALINLPGDASFVNAHILVEDTGVAASARVQTGHLIYKPDGDTGGDASVNAHGTFVFNQISSSGSGPVPPANIYVAKTARTVAGVTNFYMQDILQGWQRFSAEMHSAKSVSNTWIVNLSAQGEPAPDTQPPPLPPADKNLLVIAAAGNGSSQINTTYEAFPKFSNGNLNLIIVGALATDGTLALYSNNHPQNVQLLCTGDCVCGTPGQQLNGTSQAAPLVTIAAAAVSSMHPKWYPRQVIWRLFSTADRVSTFDNNALAGRLNVKKALADVIFGTVNNPGNTKSSIEASGITFDATWKLRLETFESGLPDSPVLRLYGPSRYQDQTCFKTMRALTYANDTFCIVNSAAFTFLTKSGPIIATAGDLDDLSLPLPVQRASSLPTITIKSDN